MSRKILAVVLVFLCFAPIALVQIPSTNGELTPTSSSEPAAARSLTSHDPIYIEGDDQFTPANGVASGNGTAGNPYIIKNWVINNSVSQGIHLHNTNAYVIIRNCTIYNNSDCGVWLENVGTCSVINCSVYSNNWENILLHSSKNNLISGCAVYSNNHYGIVLAGSDNNQISNCSVSDNPDYDIWLSSSSGNEIVYCNVSNSSYGIEIVNSFDSLITNNNIFLNNYGVHLSSGSNNGYFYYNNLFGNTINTYDECTNYWDNGVEGNYWSDYNGYDTNGDGIGNDIYNIPGGNNKDYYPLMFPYPTRPNIKASNLTLKSTAQGLKISANISNTDAFSDHSNVTVGFFVNASSVSTQQINIPRNTTQTIFAYWQAPVGKYTLKVKADPENLVKEINELDNEVSTYIELSDVAVATEDISAAVVQNGIQINVTLHNQGPALIGAPTYIYIDNEFEYQELVGVPAQGSNNISFIWNGPSGTYEVLVVVDPENIFIEADETNNNATKTIIMLAGAPDLGITSADIYFNPSTPVEGRNTTITAICHNIGYATSSTATITFYDNENIIYTTALPAIEQGGQYPISTTFTAYDGHTIKVEITTTGTEYNLGNNYATAKITTVLPDLYIDSKNITITPSKPVEGGSTSITAKIYNIGEGAGEASVQFFADSNLIGEKQTGEIPPGLSAEVTVIWNNTTAGAIISVKILPSYPDEQSWNNEAETLLEETKTYNLVPKNITFSLDTPIQNQSITVTVEIWNTGEANSPNAVITFWDGNTLICNESIGPVPPGEHLNVSATWARAQKEHTVYVKIDISPYTASKLLLYTRMPDLTVSNITFSERYPENNKTILIYITVKNQGNATSEQAELKVYAGDTLLQVITIAPLPTGASDTKEVSWQARNLVRIKAEFSTSIDANTGNNFLDLLSPETRQSPPQSPEPVPNITILVGAGIGAGIVGAIGIAFLIGRHGIASLGIKKTGEELITQSPYQRILNYTKEFPGSTIKAISEDLGMPYKKTWKRVHKLAEERRGKILKLIKKEGEKDVWVYPEEICVPQLLPPQREILQKLIRHADGGIPPSLLHDMIGTRWGKLQDYMKGTTTIVGLEQTGYVVSRTIGERTKYMLNPDLKKVIDVLQKNPDTTARGLEDATKIKLEDIKKYLDMLVVADIVTRRGIGEEARYNLKVVMG